MIYESRAEEEYVRSRLDKLRKLEEADAEGWIELPRNLFYLAAGLFVAFYVTPIAMWFVGNFFAWLISLVFGPV